LRALALDGNPLASISLRSPTLEHLDVTDCGLDVLDVSGLPSLVELQCMRNRIRVLDLSAVRLLQSLWCAGNGANVTLPKAAPLRRLVMGNNPRASFDASAFPALEMLFVDGMGLETLVLGNSSLEHVRASGNALNGLDLSKAPAVRVLDVSSNAISAIDLTPLRKLRELTLDASVETTCTELQKHTLPVLRTRFGLPRPTKTLSKMDGFQLHAFVQQYNWDDGPKRLFDVIRHPACSLTTALLVYWQTQPGEFAEHATAARAPRDVKKWVELLREIESGIASRKWAPNGIEFDAHDVDGVDLSDDDTRIPASMRVPVAGGPSARGRR
jgi:hypothetical protein